MVCLLACRWFALVVRRGWFGIAWPDCLAVFAMCASVLQIVVTTGLVSLSDAAARALAVQDANGWTKSVTTPSEPPIPSLF